MGRSLCRIEHPRFLVRPGGQGFEAGNFCWTCEPS